MKMKTIMKGRDAVAYFSTHNHSSYSNAKVGLDSINRIEEMIAYAGEIGLNGIVLSDHELLSGHVKWIDEYKKLKKEGRLKNDFKIGLGNEIYLCLEDNLEELKENQASRHLNPDSQFYHFLLIALNENGYTQLKKLSSLAWENSWRDGLVTRTPTFLKSLREIVQQGDIAATSACLGGVIPQTLLRIREASINNDSESVKFYQDRLHSIIDQYVEVFGKDNFYLEVQPSDNEEQKYVNRQIIRLSQLTGLKYTIATDAHYLKKEDRQSHKYYLKAQNIAREVDEFYDSTFIMSEEEVREYLTEYMTEEEIQAGFDATMDIYHKIKFFELERDIVVPLPPIPKFEFQHVLEQGYDMYEYIKKYAYSEHEIDRYLLHLIQEGLIELIVNKRKADKEYFHKCLDRINTELKELWLISERLGQRLSAYYALTKDVIDTAWEEGDSIVGVARGSAAGFLIVFLLKISQINPLDYDLPHFRHLTAERPELPDIDFDTQQNRRGRILKALKDRYGEKRVLNIATFSTEGSRSALLSAARGMGIDSSEVDYLTSLIPVERGFTWSLKDCFYESKDGTRKPVTELVNAVEKYKGLKETALKIEGLIKARSIHASGLYKFQGDYTEQNAMMMSNSGIPTTQFDMGDSDKMGALKLDALTVQGIDRIRTALDLLVEDGLIEDKGSLRETYEHAIHPDVLDYDNKEMWSKVATNEIPDLFQFDTAVGLQCAKKAKPQTVEELAAANSLMRLMSDGEQPIDKFVRHKENLQEWYDEMQKYELNEKEVAIMEKHVGKAYGVGSSQEELMLILMDKDVCSFSISEANDARKIVGKKLMDKIPSLKEKIFTREIARENFIQYVWDSLVLPQLGYSFSYLHSASYSLIALQEMNLAHFFPRVYWDTACLTVTASADEDNDSNKGGDYGRVATAIGKMKQQGVDVGLPSINHSKYGFVPDPKNNRIISGLKSISGINDEVVKTIMEHRPYQSFDVFYDRMYTTKTIQRSHMLQLIKAGCFNEFDTSVNIMKQFIFKETDKKESLNMQNFPSIVRLGLLKDNLQIYQELFNFRKHINKCVHEKISKPKDSILKLDRHSTEFFSEHFTADSITNQDSEYVYISAKLFDKEYQKLMQPIREQINTEDFIRQFNVAQFHELWEQFASGTPESWEMDSVSFYSDKHELSEVDKKRYGIVNFHDLSPEPIVTGSRMWRGREIFDHELFTIVGTVVDKNNDKHTFTLLTEDGVTVCKTYAGAYAHYNRQIKSNGEVVDQSWFKRGTKLMVRGFRRDDQFVLKSEKNSHTINKILYVRKDDGTLAIQSERVRN